MYVVSHYVLLSNPTFFFIFFKMNVNKNRVGEIKDKTHSKYYKDLIMSYVLTLNIYSFARI